MRDLILARHGESVFSERALVNGDPTIPGGLTPAGIEQARALGVALEPLRIDLCVTTEFERVIETADEALRGRDVPRLVMPGLDDPRLGPFEGATLESYRDWARNAPSSERPGGDGESRLDIVGRYARSYRELLGRPEQTILVVAHSLPLSYAIAAHEGRAPGARMPLVEYATPYRLDAHELAAVIQTLEDWLAAPSF